jgi:cytochrome P450
MLDLTQKVFGGEGSRRRRAGRRRSRPDLHGALLDLAVYFKGITDDRRAHPTTDIASTIANGRIDGQPLGDLETAGYYSIIATAGHDTTSSTLGRRLRSVDPRPHAASRSSGRSVRASRTR